MNVGRRMQSTQFMTLVALALIALPRATAANTPELSVKDGCICMAGSDGATVRLTSHGKDRAPVLSPDGQAVAFIRKASKQAMLVVGSEEDYPGGQVLADQIWVLDLGTKHARILVDAVPSALAADVTGNEKVHVHIDDTSVCFSPDGECLYFIASAWATSGALYKTDTRSGTTSLMFAANTVEVVMAGTYRNHLIIQQHRYFLAGGSYDWFWLFSPEGKEIGPVGKNREQVTAFLATCTR